MRKKLILLGVVAAYVFLFAACSDDHESTPAPYFYIPAGFPDPVYQFQNNEVTDAGFALGKKLFYDPLLSRDSTIACGSCHQQFVAFAHSDHRLSHGVDNLLGTRNSPGLFNIAWFPNFMWDGGVNHLEVQPLAPIANPVEMDESMANVIVKLKRSSFYPTMYKAAFGTDTITTQATMRAMAQFMGSMISANSKYDKYVNGKTSITANELNGLQVFRAKCESCHKEPLLTDMSFRNNGLDQSFANDPGRAKITTLPQDSGLFRVPSLRNIALTFPYMHDGRFKTLMDVLNHYDSGIQMSSTLDPLLTSGSIPLTLQEKNDVISFLNILTDYSFIQNNRFKE
ncbi:MAG: cytochrome-c peroxidase [Bacteroidetes bacterium]|nr:cytochrome-c peroxidase [Bacteroidota bacterium]